MIGRTILGRHRIVRALAKGGMGVVYLARSEGASGFTRPVVVKRMASDLMVDDSMARMFVREARLMSRLRHPGLVQVIDFGEERGDYLMVIEYVHGYHLGQWNRYIKTTRGPFPTQLLIHIMAQVLDALHYAHELRDSDGRQLHIVHRDVSPSNILIDVDGHVKLADFGVARSKEQTEQTDQSTIKGKMPYLAPELFRLKEPSANTDAYACAVVLHELLTGKNEFRAADVATTVSRVLEHVPTPVDAVRDDLPDGLGDVIGRALSKEADERYQNAAELARALRVVRSLAENEADESLRATAQDDFTNQLIRTTIRFPSLSEREEAWQNPPPELLPNEHADLRRYSSSPPTLAETPPELQTAPQPGGGRAWLWALALVALLGASGSGAYLALQTDDAAPIDRGPTFVVVQSNQDAGAEEFPDLVDAGPGTDAGEQTVVPPTKVVRTPSKRASRRNLTAAFARRRGEVVTCFRQHGGASSPESIEVAFTVGTEGQVVATGINPPSVASTPLGSCVLGIARSTRFPPQQAQVRFRIPLRVRVE